MSKPLFSIITCTYNSEKYIKENITSVQMQNFTDYEHIFIDGISQDATREILDEYQKNSNQSIKIYSHTPQWISHAMNEWIKQASWKYLIHLHSDDAFYDQSVLKDVSCFLSKHQYKFDRIYGICHVRDEKRLHIWFFPTKRIFHHSHKSIIWKHLLNIINFIPHQWVFIKKEVFKKYGMFDESLKYWMDPDLRMRIKNKTKRVFFDRTIAHYMIRPWAQSSGKKNTIQNHQTRKKIYKKYNNFFTYIIALSLRNLISLIYERKNKR